MSTAIAAAEAKPKTLDDIMLAMDVVDTLRHNENLVAREFDETRREAELVERLRELYKNQGIEVPDRVILQGVAALKESRFVYSPPKPGMGVTLAKLWIARHRFGKAVMAGVAAIGILGGGWYFGIERPRQAEAMRIEREIGEIIPRDLTLRHGEALSEARVEPARARANALLSDGRTALARRDAAGARQAVAGLEALRADLVREYWLRIVSRPNEPTGVWRVPQRNPNARNWYVIVEAVTPAGQLVELPILNEETGRTETVSKFGVRVNESLFQSVSRDKQDDGIVQRNRLGEKRRGELDISYGSPMPGGMITRW
jgi:Family of unknown function (DUF6384)